MVPAACAISATSVTGFRTPVSLFAAITDTSATSVSSNASSAWEIDEAAGSDGRDLHGGRTLRSEPTRGSADGDVFDSGDQDPRPVGRCPVHDALQRQVVGFGRPGREYDASRAAADHGCNMLAGFIDSGGLPSPEPMCR